MVTSAAVDDAPDRWIKVLDNRLHKIADSRDEYTEPAVASISQILDTLRAYLQSQKAENVAVGGDQVAQQDIETQRHLLQLILDLVRYAYMILCTLDRILPASIVGDWFKVLADFSFCNVLQAILSQHQRFVDQIRGLLSIVLVRLLNVDAVIQCIDETSLSPDESAFYMFDNDCVETISRSINSAIEAEAFHIAPAMICWAAIGRRLRQEAAVDDDGDFVTRRDSLSSSRRLSRSDIPQLTRKYIESWRAYTSVSDTDFGAVPHFAMFAIRDFNVLGLVIQISEMLEDMLGQLVLNQASQYLIRRDLITTLQYTCILSNYTATAGEALIAILQGNRTENVDETRRYAHIHQKLVNDVFQNEDILSKILDQALFRYPYELVPFILICRSLCVSDTVATGEAPNMLEFLGHVPTLTDRVPEKFVGYEVTRESERETVFVLREVLMLFSPPERTRSSFRFKHSSALTLFDNSETISLQRGVEGVALTKERQPVVAWTYNHSALTYFGRWLFEAQSGRIQLQPSMGSINDISSEIIHLLAKLVKGGQRQDDTAEKVLGEASDSLPQDADIVSVIGSVFERALCSPIRQEDTDTVLLISRCLNFFGALLKHLPGRIWPILTRQDLFGENESKTRLYSIIGSVEHVASAPALLDDILELYSSLLDDVVGNAVPRASVTKSNVHRFQQTRSIDPGVPLKQISKTMNSFTGLVLTMLRAVNETEFQNIRQKFEIGSRCIHLLHRLVSLAHGSGPGDSSISPGIRHAASGIMNFFLRSPSRHSNIALVITPCTPLITIPSHAIDVSTLIVLQEFMAESAAFITMLLRTSKLLDLSATEVIKYLLQAIPLYIRVYAAQPLLKANVLSLLTVFVESAAKLNGDAPSVFAQLGPDLTQDAVLLVSELDDVSESPELAKNKWQFFSSCICNKQTWFASYLLTGETPSKVAKRKGSEKASEIHRKPVLEIALDILSALPNLQDGASVAVLRFVSDALNHWPWAINSINSHPHFLPRLTEQLENLQWDPAETPSKDPIALAWQTAGVGLVCEILAMYLHSMRVVGNKDRLKEWSSKIPLLDQPGFKDPAYNRNLHYHLQENFERRFPSLKIEDLRKRRSSSEYGSDFYYNIAYASELLQSMDAWNSGGSRTSYRHEFEKANQNLSLVDAQRAMMANWKLLCLELVQGSTEDDKLHKKLAYVAYECLEANKESEEKESIFAELRLLRIDLAATIMQRLVESRYTGSAMHGLLGAAWGVMRASKPNFDNAFAGDDSDYYRFCVKLLLLCLKPYAYADMLNTSDDSTTTTTSAGSSNERRRADRTRALQISNTMLEIAVEVVAKGFRSLAAQLHEDPQSVLPHDFGLLTSLLQAMLQTRGAESANLHSQLALRLADFDLGRYATALFSWSNQIKILGSDPIYGDLSIAFLVEMSTLPPLAESLATDGILSRLNTADLMSNFLRPVGPLDQPPRAHRIWSRGLLPLVLNVLVAVGLPFAAEAATFLNNFAPQLTLASNALDSKAVPTARDPAAGCITLNAASEAHTLSLIAVTLDYYRTNNDADIPDLAWDRVAVKEDVEAWIQGTRAFLRERIKVLSETEAGLLRKKALGVDRALCACESRLEELVLGELRGVAVVLGAAAAS